MFYCLLRSFVITINFWKNICTFLLYYCSLTLKSESSGRMTYFFLGIFRPSTLAISFIWGNLFGNTLFFSITPYHFIHLSREIHISIKQKKIYIHMLCTFRINFSLRKDFWNTQSSRGEQNVKGLWDCSMGILLQTSEEGRAVYVIGLFEDPYNSPKKILELRWPWNLSWVWAKKSDPYFPGLYNFVVFQMPAESWVLQRKLPAFWVESSCEPVTGSGYKDPIWVTCIEHLPHSCQPLGWSLDSWNHRYQITVFALRENWYSVIQWPLTFLSC